jgi:hypothetical protein
MLLKRFIKYSKSAVMSLYYLPLQSLSEGLKCVCKKVSGRGCKGVECNVKIWVL